MHVSTEQPCTAFEVPRLYAFNVPLASDARSNTALSPKLRNSSPELDTGIESLKTARAQLKVYRQAVLKHAFEGKLTARWREENKGET